MYFILWKGVLCYGFVGNYLNHGYCILLFEGWCIKWMNYINYKIVNCLLKLWRLNMDILVWFGMPLLAWFVGFMILDPKSFTRFFK